MSVINITQEQFKRFLAIKEKRAQDSKASETFEHILQFYEGKSVLPLQEAAPKKLSEIIDAEKAQKELAPTRNNQFIQLKR